MRKRMPGVAASAQQKIRRVLVGIVSICILSLIGPNAAMAQEYKSIPPLDEAALKHSPGNLISEKLKKSKQFYLLNELVVIDELLLKQTKLKDLVKDDPDCKCPGEIPEELYCQQLEVILLRKKANVEKLDEATAGTNFKEFESLDLLIELEIVDDLLIVQPEVRRALYDIIKSRKCRGLRIKGAQSLMDKQGQVLIKKKKAIIKVFNEQLIDR